jgi:flagellar assembly protein FliH
MKIIKAQDREGRIGVRGLVLGSHRPTAPVIVPDPAQVAMDALRVRVEALSDQLAAKDRELADLRKAMVQTRQESLGEGRAIGLAEAESREAERLGALEKSLAEGVAQLAGSLEALEPLALLVARESLDKILGDPDAYAELISGLVRRQLAGMKDQSVLAVEVSAEDFPDADALASLVTDLARPAVTVAVGEDLASGCCRLRLKLGGVEVGPHPQWDHLGQLLRRMAEDGAP